MQPNDSPAPAAPRPLDVDVRTERNLGTFLQEDRVDTTDEAWLRGMTPMNVLRRDEDEDTSDAPTVISGGPEELPDLSDLFPMVRKKEEPAPASEEAEPSQAAETPEPEAQASAPPQEAEEAEAPSVAQGAVAPADPPPPASEVASASPEAPPAPSAESLPSPSAEAPAAPAPQPAQAGPPVALIFGAGLGLGLLLALGAFLLLGG